MELQLRDKIPQGTLQQHLLLNTSLLADLCGHEVAELQTAACCQQKKDVSMKLRILGDIDAPMIEL